MRTVLALAVVALVLGACSSCPQMRSGGTALAPCTTGSCTIAAR